MPKPKRRPPVPPPDRSQLPLPMPDPIEAARLTRELLARLNRRDRDPGARVANAVPVVPAGPAPWLLPIELPAATRRRG